MHCPSPAFFLLGLCLGLLPGLAAAAAVAIAAAEVITPQMIAIIAPSSVSCAGASPDCRTADQAAPFITRAMSSHGLNTKAEIAAVLSLMAFESGELKYKHNISPGRPGQGTSNMQLANWNLRYAKSIPQVRDKVAKFTSTKGLSAAQLDEILSYVTPDEYNFGSGAWYLTTQCGEGVRQALRANVDAGFWAYMGCVGVVVTQDRLEYLRRAKQAFGI